MYECIFAHANVFSNLLNLPFSRVVYDVHFQSLYLVYKRFEREMVAVKFVFTAVLLRVFLCHGYVFTTKTDYRDFDANCIAEYVNNNFNYSVQFR